MKIINIENIKKTHHATKSNPERQLSFPLSKLKERFELSMLHHWRIPFLWVAFPHQGSGYSRQWCWRGLVMTIFLLPSERLFVLCPWVVPAAPLSIPPTNYPEQPTKDNFLTIASLWACKKCTYRTILIEIAYRKMWREGLNETIWQQIKQMDSPPVFDTVQLLQKRLSLRFLLAGIPSLLQSLNLGWNYPFFEAGFGSFKSLAEFMVIFPPAAQSLSHLSRKITKFSQLLWLLKAITQDSNCQLLYLFLLQGKLTSNSSHCYNYTRLNPHQG